MTGETQSTICAWATDTFGPASSDIRVAARANEELAEAVRAVTAGKPVEDVAEEIADTMIVLCRLGARLEVTLLMDPYDGEVMPPHAPLGRVMEANKEMAALLARMANGASLVDQVMYLKFLWRALHLAIQSVGFTAQSVIDAKMFVNRNRKWKVEGGHGYHLREKSAS